uniref:Uncharacterized protein n=1 Tax=Anguilla anguilla TaxID=7936 RepID=A0A0E9W4M6_ANGAN
MYNAGSSHSEMRVGEVSLSHLKEKVMNTKYSVLLTEINN